MIKTFKYFLQALLLYFSLIFGKVMGLKLSRKLFSFIFLYIAPSFKSKKIIKKNLALFKEDLTEFEQKEIISNMWKNYGMTFVEYVYLDVFRKSNSHVKVIGNNILDKIIKSGRPVIFVSGHFANYELMSMEITKNNIKLATIYRPLNNFFINPLMEYLRKKYVCRNQIKKGINGVREAIEYIKNDHSIALMIDQRVSEGEQINFFNHPALTTTLPAQLALKYNLIIIPVFIERTTHNNFILEFQTEINPNNYKNKLELSIKLNEVLEKMILKNPNEWIWTHNRWK